MILVCEDNKQSGPVVEIGDGVSQPSISGKYACFCSNSLPDQLQFFSFPSDLVDHNNIDTGTQYSIQLNPNNQSTPTTTEHQVERSFTSSSQPGRSAASILEVSGSSSSVRPFPASVLHSRPGPVARCGSEIFQSALLGKYTQVFAFPMPDAVPNFSILDSTDASDASSTLTHGHPERTVESHMEALNPSDAVQPPAVVVLHSRSGPAVGSGARVFQPLNNGEYSTYVSSQSMPDAHVPSRNIGVSKVRRKEDIVIYYQNVGGMNSRVNDYRMAVSDSCFDIIVLTETWLDSRTLSSQVFGTDYEVFRCDRNPNNSRKLTGGGVLVAVRSRLKAKLIEKESWKCLEQVWVSIKLGDRSLLLCTLYIAPDRVRDNELIEAHCDSVITAMESANPVDDIFILGDFNLPGIS